MIRPHDCKVQGALAPLVASVSLLGLYLLIKYFPDLSFQAFLDVYFFLIGSFAMGAGASSLLKV